MRPRITSPVATSSRDGPQAVSRTGPRLRRPHRVGRTDRGHEPDHSQDNARRCGAATHRLMARLVAAG